MNLRDVTCLPAWLILLATMSPGCKQLEEVGKQLPSAAIIEAPANRSSANNVIPTAEPIETFTVVVEKERYLSDIARALGSTVDDLMIDNDLGQSRLKPGLRLRVRTTSSRYARFLQRRERKAQRANSRTHGGKSLRKTRRKRPKRRMVKRRSPNRAKRRRAATSKSLKKKKKR